MIDYREIITIEPEKRFGKSCVRNTPITVYEVLAWMASGMIEWKYWKTLQNLQDDLSACLAYAADKERTIRIA